MALLKYGSKGNEVAQLQTRLKEAGYDPGAIDGIYGNNTKQAVIGYQKYKGLGVDGIVGDQTWGALNTAQQPQAQAQVQAPVQAPAQAPAQPAATPASSVSAIQQAWQAANAQPTLNGINVDNYKKNLLDQSNASINQSADSQYATINQNLAEVLSSLDAEKSTGQQTYDKQLQTIHDNEFATTEAQKEVMNGSGWNMQNSGLAQGEVNKIKIGADKNRADASGSLANVLNDIARRVSLANTKSSNDKATVDKWKTTETTKSQAEASLKAEDKQYQLWQDALSNWKDDRNFNYQGAVDERNFGYQKERDTVSDNQWNTQFDYQKNRDVTTDSQWQKQFDATQNQNAFENSMAQKQLQISAKKASGSGSSSSKPTQAEITRQEKQNAQLKYADTLDFLNNWANGKDSNGNDVERADRNNILEWIGNNAGALTAEGLDTDQLKKWADGNFNWYRDENGEWQKVER